MKYTTYQLAQMAGVTVRLLQYYDTIGLLRPSERNFSGYRLYSEHDVDKLQQILLYRELDFSLKKIAAIMNKPGYDKIEAIKGQLSLLKNRAERYENLVKLAQQTLKSLKGEVNMSDKEKFSGFDYDKMMAEQKQYEQEVTERWGDTDAYKESARRTKGYSKDDWARISAEQSAVYVALADCLSRGIPPESDEVQAHVEAGRVLIDKYFYPCSREFMANLGQMYVSDPRFAKTFNDIAPGLCDYYCAAISHYSR